MKKLILGTLAFALAVLILNGCPKWDQPHSWKLSGATSQYVLDPQGREYAAENADDFECRSKKKITRVQWWGVHCFEGKPTDKTEPVYFYHDFSNPVYYDYCRCPFIIRFYSDNGKRAPDSLPQGKPIGEYYVTPSVERLEGPAPKFGFKYDADLDPPFVQREGAKYWISIMLYCKGYKLGPLDKEHHPQWFWQFSSKDVWSDYPAQRSKRWYGDEQWHSLYLSPPPGTKPKTINTDMAFKLWE